MNGAVLVSQFLQRGSWEDGSELQKPWYDEWKKKIQLLPAILKPMVLESQSMASI
jgi:hypothetical protein